MVLFDQVLEQRFSFVREVDGGYEIREQYDVSMPVGDPLFMEVTRVLNQGSPTLVRIEISSKTVKVHSSEGNGLDGLILEKAKWVCAEQARLRLGE